MAAERKTSRVSGVRLDGRVVAGRPMSIAIAFDHQDETEKPLATGGYMRAPYRATLTDDSVEVSLVVDVIDAHVSCTGYTITALDGVGLEHRTTEVFRGLKLRDLLANVVAVVPPAGGEFDAAQAIVEAAGASVRRRRRPVDDERLREVAEAYRERWIPGSAGYLEFARSIGASERQMWNLLRLARERGFLPAKRED